MGTESNQMATSRLNAYDHAEILAAYRAGVSFEQLAQEYNRKIETIKTILRKKVEAQ